jgi:hypothetical protein
MTPAGARGTRAFTRAEVGVGLLVGSPGSPPALSPVVRLGLGTEAFSARVSVIAPAVGAEVSATHGSASVRQALLLGELASAWPTEGPWAFVGSLGAGAAQTHVEGSAPPPYLVQRANTWTFAGTAGVGGLIRLGARVGLLAEFHAVLLAPNVAVQIADETVSAHRPAELATLGVWGTF